jgi:cytochrome c oxidase subunit 3
MAKRLHYSEQPEIREKKAKNLLWVGIISIVMMFAGFTSAYIVLASDTFWVKLRMPDAFIWSIVTAVAGSGTLYLALRMVKANKQGPFKALVLATLVLGSAFGYLQYQGWGDLFQRGNALVGNLSSEGRYGLNYTIAMNGAPLVFDGERFYTNDQALDENQTERLKEFAALVADAPLKTDENFYDVGGYPEFVIRFKDKPLELKEGKFYMIFQDQSRAITYDQRIHLQRFARNIRDGRGDFVMMGKYGVDYTILYKGVPLSYENRKLFKPDGSELSKVEYALLFKSRNTASSFIYILTGLHLLHFIGGMIYLISISFGAMRGKFGPSNHLKVKLAGMYWHFLAGLWIYLFIFLTFIH